MAKLKYQLVLMKDLGCDVLYDILQLRQEIFVVEQKCYYLDADGLDQQAYHFIGRDEKKQILSYLRIIPPASEGEPVRIGRVLVRAGHRGKGLAREIMEEALARIQAIYTKKPVKISAQTYLQGFYTSLDFVKTSEPYDEDGIEHVDMVRGTGDLFERKTSISSGDSCLSAELLKSFAERSCSEDEKHRCVKHIRDCKACYATYMALMMSGLKEEEQKKKGRVIYLMNHPVNLNALGLSLLIVAVGIIVMFVL